MTQPPKQQLYCCIVENYAYKSISMHSVNASHYHDLTILYTHQLLCKMVLASRVSQTNPLSYRIGPFLHKDQPAPIEPVLSLGLSGK